MSPINLSQHPGAPGLHGNGDLLRRSGENVPVPQILADSACCFLSNAGIRLIVMGQTNAWRLGVGIDTSFAKFGLVVDY
jgi:hypothetical protein